MSQTLTRQSSKRTPGEYNDGKSCLKLGDDALDVIAHLTYAAKYIAYFLLAPPQRLEYLSLRLGLQR